VTAVSSRDPGAGDPKTQCEQCGRELDDDEVYELDGMILCWDCITEEEDLRGIEEEWVE
jgi:formylmethanofuran dehydrogenase subunit E